MPSFTDRLAESNVLLADGATGTNYQDMGIEPGVAPEEWVVDAPDRVRELHRRFADAGSDLVLTCSFGATTPRLADGPLAGRAREVNIRAAELAREAVGDDRLVAGSLGPTGQLVEPYGLLTRELCVAAYAEQAQAPEPRGSPPALASGICGRRWDHRRTSDEQSRSFWRPARTAPAIVARTPLKQARTMRAMAAEPSRSR